MLIFSFSCEYKIDIELDGKVLNICTIICHAIEEPIGSFVRIPEIVNSRERITFDGNHFIYANFLIHFSLQ